MNGAFWFGSVWVSPGRLLGEPMVRVQDGSIKWVLGLGQGVGKLSECELRLSDRFIKGRKGEKPPLDGYGAVMGRFWEEGMGFLVTVRPGGWGQFKSSSPSHFCQTGRFLLN